MSSKSKLLTAFLLVLTIWSPTSVAAKPNNPNFIQCPWERDGRQWNPLEHSTHNQEGLVQYLPAGDQAKDWREMVTTQWYENANQSPADYFDEFMGGVRGLFPNCQVFSTTIHKNNLSLTAEWWTDGNKEQMRYGMVKIFALHPHVYLLSYTTCDTTAVARAKQVWLPMLQQAQLNYPVLETME